MKKTYWCGFENGRIAPQLSGVYRYPHLFERKKDALNYYDDVRKVTIEEVTK